MTDPGRCLRLVSAPGMWHSHQCSRKVVRDGFCTQHHPDSEKKRQDASYAKFAEQHRRANLRRLGAFLEWLHDRDEGAYQDLLPHVKAWRAPPAEAKAPDNFKDIP